MPLDWERIASLSEDVGKDILTMVKPYLPALAREGQDLFDGFIRHLLDEDFESIDRMMYERMTRQERRELENDVYQAARAAAQARFRRIRLSKEILTKALIRLALALI